MEHDNTHTTLEQWDRWICLHPECGAVVPKIFTDPEIPTLSPTTEGEETVPMEAEPAPKRGRKR